MFTPPLAPGAYHEQRYCAAPFAPLPSAGDAGMKYGPMRHFLASASAESLIAGVKSIRSDSTSPCCAYGAGRLGTGCVGDVFSSGTSLWRTGVSGMGQIGSAGAGLSA